MLFAAVIVTGLHGQEPEFAWRYTTPEAQGIDAAVLAPLFAQVQRDRVALHGFVLVRHDRIVSEAYGYPYTADTRHALYSVSKSFTAALLGIAIDQGLFTGVDERVQDIFEGVTSQAPAERMGRMRLKHLLAMSSGHATDTTNRITYSYDWAKTFMELPVEAEPGSIFVYNSGASYMLAAAIQRRARTTALAFAQENLFGPLGITNYTWDTSPTNVICGGWGLSLRPLDLARFGLMYLRRGQWNGRQVVPAWWVDECATKHSDNGTGGFWGSGYGYQFWLNDFGGYRADGAFAQYIFILPDYDAVAVFTCNLTSDTELPGRLMRQHVLPAMRSAEPLPANPRGVALLANAADALGRNPAAAALPPTFTTLPANQTVTEGAAVTFTATAAGRPAPALQWYHDEMPIGGATAETLRIPAARAADAGEYHVVLRNSTGAVASAPVALTVLAAPAIVQSPRACVAAEGGEAVFQVGATGDHLTYAWQHDGVAVEGVNASTLRLAGVTTAQAGTYRAVVTNASGRAESAPATLTVAAADPVARLVNLSARASARADDETLITGFVIGGGQPSAGLPVLLRGVGPSLVDYGVEGVLADPTAALFIDGMRAAGCSDWRGDPALQAAAQCAGAAPIGGLSADAVLQRVLPAGRYTMHVTSSLPDRDGVALAECFDASGGAAAGSPRLVNLSARARAGAGDQALIGGFVIAGRGSLRVLVRGIGPALRDSNVSGVLGDPELRLFKAGVEIAHNDDWAGRAELAQAFAEVGAFALPSDSKDAALLVTLPAGIYTAHVTGKSDTAGVALVEVYALP